MTDAKDYEAAIKDKGFVPATKAAMVQVVTNTESVAKLRTEMDEVIAALGKRLEKLEKKP